MAFAACDIVADHIRLAADIASGSKRPGLCDLWRGVYRDGIGMAVGSRRRAADLERLPGRCLGASRRRGDRTGTQADVVGSSGLRSSFWTAEGHSSNLAACSAQRNPFFNVRTGQ